MTSHAEDPEQERMRAPDLRFFWIEGEGAGDQGSYHWRVDCPRVMVALWYGGRLVSSEAPPPGAADAALTKEILEKDLQSPAWDTSVIADPPDESSQDRWLCDIRSKYFPSTEADPWPVEEEPCQKCGCVRELHAARLRGPFDKGCGMFWLHVFEEDEDGEPLTCGLIHCPCDGYAPPAGTRPGASSESIAESSTSSGGRTWVS